MYQHLEDPQTGIHGTFKIHGPVQIHGQMMVRILGKEVGIHGKMLGILGNGHLESVGHQLGKWMATTRGHSGICGTEIGILQRQQVGSGDVRKGRSLHLGSCLHLGRRYLGEAGTRRSTWMIFHLPHHIGEFG